jgi:hypothetical protein
MDGQEVLVVFVVVVVVVTVASGNVAGRTADGERTSSSLSGAA